MQEGGAMMVKLEIGRGQVGVVEHLAEQDIPVCAHLGLKPQSVHKLGGFKVQGRDQQAAEHMLEEARALERAGADTLLLECVPNALAAAIRDAVQIPVIGIGAGPGRRRPNPRVVRRARHHAGRMPRFVKNYMTGRDSPLEALRAYVRGVKDRSYPAPEHCFAE